jgi:erythromycin esterase-like protein
MEKMVVPPAQEGSWEDVLHEAGPEGKLLLTAQSGNTSATLAPRGHRAIGVVYHPDYEQGNYVPTVLPKRYDAFLYLDTTQAVHPLHWAHAHAEGEVPETYPTGV